MLACSKLATSTHFAVHQLASDSPSFHSHFAAPGVAQAGGVVAPVPVWLGAMVPKRWARRAVTRNTIKRQIYHVARDLESSLLHGAWVIRQRAGFDKVQFRSATSSHLKDAVRTELQDVLQRAAAGRQSKSLQGQAK